MNESYPLVSVVIVNYNGMRFLENCLSSLLLQTYPLFEIILVDNGSNDGSVDFVLNAFPSVTIICNNENLGFAKGNNIGIKSANGMLIASLNNDTVVTPRWIEKLVLSIISHENIGMCASKMLFMSDPDMINSTGICISRSGTSWDRGIFELDKGQYESEEEVFGPCAGAAMYKKSMLDEIGLFDEDFIAYVEDTDLAFRGRLSGWKCLYVPKAVVYHMHGGTAGFETDYTIYFGNRNIVWNTVKNFPPLLFFSSLPWIIVRNIGVIPYYTIKGHGKTVLRSKIDGIKGIPKMFAKRSPRSVNEKKIRTYIKTWAKIRSHPENRQD
ncbi:MAG: glycosyltransferase family 2 protein [ANME-2 cluster archaeon]|nr:glycosyltransferase family 2 protein [ANME-2 cluster archaeon]